MVSNPPYFNRANVHLLWLTLLSLVLSFGWFLLDGNIGIDLADEGYLWYGLRAVKAGMLPTRDFQAYDPGRYFWVTAWSTLFGEGLIGMRAACVLFSCMGVTCGLLAARRISTDWRFLVAMALCLVLWMFPRYKSFEQSIALMGVYMAVRLIERPCSRQFFLSGIFIGLMAFMGRNHGVYMVLAFGLILLILSRGEWSALPKRVLLSGAGIVVGYLPQLLMFLLAPGYFRAFFEMLARELSLGTNLGCPVPWPWLIGPENQGLMFICNAVQRCFYVALPLFIAATLFPLLSFGPAKAARHPLLIAAAAVTIPYAHFTFSRPDCVHLAHAVPALILGIAALFHWLSPVFLRAVAFGLLAATVAGLALETGLGQKTVFPEGTFVEMKVQLERLHVPERNAAPLLLARALASRLAKPGDPIAFLAHLPGLYPATNRLSPLKALYLIWPASLSEDEALIAAFKEKQIKWVLLQDEMIDGRDDLYFHNTHPQTFAYIKQVFEPVVLDISCRNVTIYRLRQASAIPEVPSP
ncbi:MAG: hypothetical protein JWL59_570 [Chthoniobacteraceae bacterium]|nr:hypothetical protein [Chthoniobacteraceae bacterium]